MRLEYALRLSAFMIGLLTIPAPKVEGAPLERVSNTTLRMPREFPIVGYGLTNAFGDLRFEEPVVLTSPPGDTNRLFVVERTGRIMVITNVASPNKSEFADLRLDELQAEHLETGLLGLAFHPGYQTNGYFFVFRTIVGTVNGLHGFYDEVARFQADPGNPNRALPGSRLRMMAQYDVSQLHNGGNLQFGPDGYLYIATGYEGPPPSDRPNLKQTIDEHLLGAVLRIDVDKRSGNLPANPHSSITTNYLVPADNPFVGATRFNGMNVDPGKVRTELYAIGLRNPWRLTFDEVTGDLYCADVGAGLVEEVNLVRPGGNFGWPFYEGQLAGPEKSSAPGALVQTGPLHSYAHGSALDEGGCIIGGPVYRGNRIPQLWGAYIFADSGNGRIWALRRDGAGEAAAEYLVSYPNQNTFGPTTLGIDPRNRDVLVANLEGHIQRLIYVPPDQAPHPRTLAETGAFANLETLQPNSGLIPYEINVPFWSDNAIKSRWFSVPGSARVGFSISNHWAFPSGTVWVKHFELEMTNGLASSRRRIETRFLVRNDMGVYGVTYRWADSRTDAELVPEGGKEDLLFIREGATVRRQRWYYPSRADCLKCHTPAAGYALGFNTAQLNRCAEGDEKNQIEALSDAGYLDAAVSSARNYPMLAHATNSAWPVEYRLRSYLAANCVQCHYPGGPPTTHWDARFIAPMSEARIVNAGSALVGAPFRIVAPHDRSRSILYGRVSTGSMPPLATTVPDAAAAELVAEYINTFPESPWQFRDVGATGREGSSSISDGIHRVAGGGTNIAGTADQFHFLSQPFRGNSQLIALLEDAPAAGKAGIMFRQSISPAAPHAMITVQSNRAGWQFRAEAGGESVESSRGLARWLRLLREGTSVTGFTSVDGVQWLELGSASLPSGDFLGGMAATSHDNALLQTAVFKEVSVLSVSLAPTARAESVLASENLEFEARVDARGANVQRVDFYDGPNLLGNITAAPYRFRWTNVVAGLHAIRAVAVDATGNAVASEPMEVAVQSPPSRSRFARKDSSTQGNWRGRYRREGSILPGDSTNLPPHATFEMSGANVVGLDAASTGKWALQRTSGSGRIASVWTSSTNLSFKLSLLDGELHSVSLYFADFDTPGSRVQKIDVKDAATGELLQSQTITNFSKGVYITFLVRGSVEFNVSPISGPGAVLGGIFIRPAKMPAARVRVVAPGGKLRFTLPTNVVLTARVTGAEPLPAAVAMFVNGQKIGEARAPHYGLIWSNAIPGTHSVLARATDAMGGRLESRPVALVVKLPRATVGPVHTDVASQGAWRGLYGLDGYAIAAHATNFPAYADVSFASSPFSPNYPTPGEHTWFAYTEDPRALLREEGIAGIMSAWVSMDMLIDVVLRDGSSRTVTLYFLDPESARRQRVEVIDVAKGKVLDRRELDRFDGHYISWRVQGHVRFRITAVLGNAVVSGLFFDPVGGEMHAKAAREMDEVRLELTRTAEGVELNWPAAAGAMVLQSRDPFRPSSSWTTVLAPRVLSGGKVRVVDKGTREGKFYRLLRLPQ